MLQLIKNNNPFTVIILLILTLLLKLGVMMHPQLPVPVEGHYSYNTVLRLLNTVLSGRAFAYSLLGVAMIFMQAMYINRIAARHKLFNRPTYIPAFTYLLLSSVYPAWNYFNETMLVIWCLLAGMDVLLSFSQTQQPRKLVFNAGFLFCMAAIVQFSAAGFLILFVIGVVMLRPFSLAEWIVGLMGYITPIYFFAGLLYLSDRLNLMPHWMHVGNSIPPHIKAMFYFVMVLIGLITLAILGFYAMQQQIPKTSIYIRRNWAAMVFYLIISIVVAIGTDLAVQSAWLIIIPSLSFVISIGLSLEKNKGFSNFILYFSLIFVIICQLAIK